MPILHSTAEVAAIAGTTVRVVDHAIRSQEILQPANDDATRGRARTFRVTQALALAVVVNLRRELAHGPGALPPDLETRMLAAVEAWLLDQPSPDVVDGVLHLNVTDSVTLCVDLCRVTTDAWNRWQDAPVFQPDLHTPDGQEPQAPKTSGTRHPAHPQHP